MEYIDPLFVAQYADKKVPWGFGGLGEIVFYRTYSRNIAELDRKERWFETLERTINGAQDIGAGYTQEEMQRLFDYMFNLKGLVAGRALWQLGTPMISKFGGPSLNNCLAGETRVVTKNGTHEIKDLVGEQTLMSVQGKWIKSEIRSFGEQALMKISLQQGKSFKSIFATSDHRWFVQGRNNKEEYLTKELYRGQKLVSTFGHRERFIATNVKSRGEWTIVSVEETDRYEEVFCAIVPETHAFVLDDNILTGNCFYTNVESIRDFQFIMDHLALGGGVGFSVERASIHSFPKVLSGVKISHERTNDADFIVPDTRQGWSRLLREVLESYFCTGESFTYSTIIVRGYGEPLKTFGGTASGPQILIEGISAISKVLDKRAGKKIRSIDALDIANVIGMIICAGSARRCLPEGTKINTINGLIPIENIKIGTRIQTVLGEDEVTDIFFQGQQNTIKIKHQFGEFECTPNHKVAVFDSLTTWGFKEAGTLTPDDLLVWDPNGCDGRSQTLPPYLYQEYTEDFPNLQNHQDRGGEGRGAKSWKNDKLCSVTGCSRSPIARGWCMGHWLRWRNNGTPTAVKNRKAPIIIPELDTDIAWLLGYLHGDGTVDPAQGRISFSGNEDYPFINQKAKDIIERFGVTANICARKNEKTINVQTFSGELANYFYTHFKQCNNSLIVPAFILESTREIRGAYLAGLFDADGSSKSRPLQLVSSVYKDFLKEIRLLYSSLGIAAHWGYERAPKNKWQSLYNLGCKSLENIELFEKYVALYSLKYSSPRKRKSQKGFSFPTKMVRRELRGGWIVASANQTVDRIKRNTGLEFEALPVKVESIEQGRLIPTYDIEVREFHQFTAEGLVVHNSAQLSAGDPDDFLFLRAKNWERGDIPSYRSHSNNSIYADSFDEIVDEFWKGYDGSGEPYGLLNRQLARTIGRLGEKVDDRYIKGYNPCGEIGLEDKEPCCLSEIFLPNISSQEELEDLSKLLYKCQKAITTLSYPYEETNQVVVKNRRLGQSISGWMQATEEQLGWVSNCYEMLRELDLKWSAEKDINPSIKLTTVKPSGTLSLLPGVSPGIHPAFARFYIRRVRIATNDPLVEYCRARGYPVQYDIGIDGQENHRQVVVSFPCVSPEKATLAKDLTAIQQLEWVVRAQKLWADNAVSVTVYYSKEELPGIKEWLKENYETKIKSVSFLLRQDHGFVLAPYEEISEEEYHKMTKKLKDVEYHENGTSELLDLGCDTGACPVR